MRSTTTYLALMAVCLLAAPADAQVTAVTSPASTVNVKAGDDWATRTFQDPIDMKQNTDLSWHVWSADAPPAGMTGMAFNQTSNGSSDMFRATSSAVPPILEILQTSNNFSAKLGRTGDNFPIDTSKYQRFSMRMCLSGSNLNQPNQAPTNTSSAAFLFWWPHPDGLFGPTFTQAGAMFTVSGCAFYVYDMTNLPIVTGAAWTANPLVRAFRIDPVYLNNINLDVDWIRLTEPGTPQTITWTGGAGDIYLDSDTNADNGNLGILADRNGSASNRSSAYSFDPSVLSPGTYRVMVCTARSTPNSTNCRHSSGSYVVNGSPTIQITAPSPEGSADDFATVQLNNAWDFDALTDIDFSQNVASFSIDPAFPAQRPDGTSLGNIRVLRGTPSASNPGDAYFDPLYIGSGRGAIKKIDADRYRVLTAEMGITGARDINGGSIARVVWKTTSEANENVSQDIIINHRAGVNVLDTIAVDMKQLLRESDASLGNAGWNGQVEIFRLDPHEFSAITEFWVRRIKLAAFETIGSSGTYTIRWTASDPGDNGATTGLTVSASYQSANAAGTAPTGSLTPITTCADVAASAGQCTWNISTMGTYFVFLTISDGVNTNSAYSKYPVIVDPANQPKPRIVLDRSAVNFGGTANGNVVTPAQEVKLNIVGSGTVNWTAAKSGSAAQLFCVSPASGTGPAVLTVSICSTAIYNGVNGPLGTVVVTSAEADNSPQSVTVNLAMSATTANPFGGFDTPFENDTLQGSIAVTGWALDDLGIAKVDILRDAHPGDPAGAVFNGRVFIATATLVEGARNDIVGLFPNAPRNYNAGWGYLMLTRGLIWEGQGFFKLYAEATDVEGHVVPLGSKSVRVDNASAAKPFGAIDSPGQGATVSGGAVLNSGWVLSPGTTVPASGVRVAVDGVFLSAPVLLEGNTFSMQDRSDITNGFPGFNTTGAGRGNFIDTTVFNDGVHTIGWFITDALNRSDGVGSRFFKTSNGNFNLTTTADAPPAMAGATTTFARLGEHEEKIQVPRTAQPVSFGVGMTPAPVFRRAAAGVGRSEVRIREMERVVVNAGATAKGETYAAYRIFDGRLHFLPIGSSFDTREGTFYWQPAPGFIGDYDFVFVKSRNGTDVSQTSVRITVGPSTATLRAGIFKPAFTLAGER